jgi:hypothetical protein
MGITGRGRDDEKTKDGTEERKKRTTTLWTKSKKEEHQRGSKERER